MAYNRKNKLQLIIDIQTVTLDHTRRGVTQRWVYDNVIYPTYRISRATYYGYLSVPAKRQLKNILATDSQMVITFEAQGTAPQI